MAKYDRNKKLDSIELQDSPNYLPDYANELTGRICNLVGVHYDTGGNPWFTTPTFRFEDGHYMIFGEHHIKQFIYKGEPLNIDIDCDCSADSWRDGNHHSKNCPLYKGDGLRRTEDYTIKI